MDLKVIALMAAVVAAIVVGVHAARAAAGGDLALVPGTEAAGSPTTDDGPVADVRYVDVVAVPGGHRLYYEAPLPDGSHELRTELITRSG